MVIKPSKSRPVIPGGQKEMQIREGGLEKKGKVCMCVWIGGDGKRLITLLIHWERAWS